MNYKRIIIVILVLFAFYFYIKRNSLIRVKSNIDHNYYLVSNTPESQKSADYLGEINIRINKLIEYMNTNKERYKLYEKYIYKLKNKYSYQVILENTDKNYTSYNLDKQKIFLCLKQRKNNNSFVDLNTMMYVILHELAHFCTDSIVLENEHNTNKEFMEIFNFLIKSAVDSNIYSYIDFKNNPKDYCGIVIGKM